MQVGELIKELEKMPDNLPVDALYLTNNLDFSFAVTCADNTGVYCLLGLEKNYLNVTVNERETGLSVVLNTE